MKSNVKKCIIIFITGKSGNIVVISEADFRSTEEALYLSSIPIMCEKIMDGLNTPLDECVEDEDE